MSDIATVAPPRTSAARGTFTEQIHVLVDPDTRAYLMGLAGETAREAGYRFVRQGETIRDVLAEAILRRYEADPAAYERLVVAGRKMLAEPVEGGAPRKA